MNLAHNESDFPVEWVTAASDRDKCLIMTGPSLLTQSASSTPMWPMLWQLPQASVVSPQDGYATQGFAHGQSIRVLGDGTFASMHVHPAIPSLHQRRQRQRQRFVQSIPPPPVYAMEPIRQVSTNPIASYGSDAAFYTRDGLKKFDNLRSQARLMPPNDYDFSVRHLPRGPASSVPSTLSALTPVQSCQSFPSPTHIPTKLHNLQLDCRDKPKAVVLVDEGLFCPSTFYPSNRDVVIELSFNKEGVTRFPGKNQQFDALLSSSHQSYLTCSSKSQIHTLVDAIIETIITNKGQFVFPQQFQGQVLWRRADLDMARAFCVNHLQLKASSRVLPAQPPVAKRAARRRRRTTAVGPKPQQSFAKEQGTTIASDEADHPELVAKLISVKFKRPRKRSRSA